MKTEDLQRPIVIHVCRDGTISYRTRRQKVFNGVALPVFSVANVEQAKALQVRFGRCQYGPHPDMKTKQLWYKLSTLPDGTDFVLRTLNGTGAHQEDGVPVLEVNELFDISGMFREWYNKYYGKRS